MIWSIISLTITIWERICNWTEHSTDWKWYFQSEFYVFMTYRHRKRVWKGYLLISQMWYLHLTFDQLHCRLPDLVIIYINHSITSKIQEQNGASITLQGCVGCICWLFPPIISSPFSLPFHSMALLSRLILNAQLGNGKTGIWGCSPLFSGTQPKPSERLPFEPFHTELQNLDFLFKVWT